MWSSGSLPLFLLAEQPLLAEDSLGLSLFGTAGSGWFGAAPLFTFSDDSGNVLPHALPLYLAGAGSDGAVRNVNLWTWGELPSLAGSVDLSLKNTGESNSLPLFIAGSGVTDGAVPFGHGLGLFLSRKPAEALTLFLAAPGTPASSGMPLFVGGAYGLDSGVPFAMPNVLGHQASGLYLTVRGW